MADALAAGEWRYAFHPRVSPLLPVLGGVFSFLSGWSGFAGVKLAASLLFALAVFPLFALFKRVFSEQVACWGVLFFLFCSHVLRYAGEGLRDAGQNPAAGYRRLGFDRDFAPLRGNGGITSGSAPRLRSEPPSVPS